MELLGTANPITCIEKRAGGQPATNQDSLRHTFQIWRMHGTKSSLDQPVQPLKRNFCWESDGPAGELARNTTTHKLYSSVFRVDAKK